jgi:hypothetical protein
MTARKSASPVPFPPVFLADGETHPFVRKFKSGLEKRLSLTRMAELFQEVELAWLLVALGRTDEAFEVVHFIESNVDFTGNHNVWSPVSAAIALEARLLRLAQKTAPREKLLKRLLKYPAVATMERDALLAWIGMAEADLAEGRAQKSTKWAVGALSSALQRACFFRETGEGDFEYAGWYDVASRDEIIEAALAELRVRIGA